MESSSNSYIDVLVSFLNVILKHRNRILVYSFSVTIIVGLIVFLIMDPIFLSSATIKTTNKSTGIAGLLGSSGSDLSSLSDITGSNTSKDLALFETILLSRRCIEETIIKFKLKDEWNLKYMQDAVKQFREKVIEISKDSKSNIIEIGVYDKYPQRAKEIAEFLIGQLNKINLEMNVQNARNNREFIEKRYYIVKEDLKHAEDSLKIYQDKYGIAPDVIVKAVTQSEIQLEVEIKAEELKLDLLKNILSQNEIEIKMQETKIAGLKKQLDILINSNDDSSKLRLKGAPELVLNYLRLVRNVEIQNKALTYLLPIFEQAKIEEKKEMPSVIILDSPDFPEVKKKPHRVTLTALSLLMSLIFFSIIELIYEYYIKVLIKSLKKQNVST